MAGSSRVLRALFAGAASLLVVAVAIEGCGGRDQLGIPFEESGGPGPGPGVGGNGNTGGDISDGGFGGVIDVGPGPGGFGGFGGMSSSSDVGPGPTTNVTVGTSVSVGPSTSVSSVGPSSSVVTVGTSVSSVGPSSSVSTVNSVSTVVGVGGMGPGTITSVGSGMGGGNPLDCLTCLANNCPSAIQCVTNPTCLQGVICSVQNCLGMGPPNFVCVLNCFNNDLQAALLALQTIGCAFNQCGSECQGLLGP